MNYWIYDGAAERGPYTIDQLRQLGITPSTPVWREGLADWCRADLLPELAALWRPEPACNLQTQAEPVQDIPVDNPTPPELPNPAEPPTLPDNADQPYDQPMPQDMYGFQQPVQPQYNNSMEPVQAQGEPCPPSHLGWAIASTVLCCLPLGVVAIIMSSKVQQRYNRGDLQGAKRASEATDWWIIGSIVGGILSAPLSLLFM